MTDTPTSLDALGIEPVAWLYVHEFSTGTRHSIVCPQSERMESPESRGWTETPLYSATDLAPLIAKARRVDELEAVLRDLIQQCWESEKALTEELHHMDYCGESWPLTKARAALKENTDGQ